MAAKKGSLSIMVLIVSLRTFTRYMKIMVCIHWMKSYIRKFNCINNV